MGKKLDLITIGETMAIFDPVSDGPLRSIHQFTKRFGGAESNVAIGLARLGKSVGWISKVGKDELGQYLIESIRGAGVDTSNVLQDSEAPTGLYIKERIRNKNQVYYYRSGSAASQLRKKDIEWDYISQAKIIHLTGITPFLSDSCLEVVEEVMAFARANNILVSFDPNIRLKLIRNKKNAKEILLNLSKKADLLLPGIDEAELMIGTRDYKEISNYFLSYDVKKIAIKNGAKGTYYASTEGEEGFHKSYPVSKVVDPIGAGDGFASGILNGLLEERTLGESVDLGAIIGAMVVTVFGDIEGLPEKEAIESFLNSTQDVLR